MKYISGSERETEEIAERLGGELRQGDVVALFGEIGAGKTVFARGLARGLGYGGRVTSPTYAIVNEYQTGDGVPIFHFDLYRLASSDELYEIGWEDYLERRGVCVVEWSERAADALPENAVRVTIEREDAARSITII